MPDKTTSKFIIYEKAWNTMQQYARIAYDKDKNEISGLTCLKKVKHPETGQRVWELFDPVILKQENTGTTTELDKDALTEYYVKTAAHHHPENIRFCWWHSHHTMGAFWSGTDLKEIKAWKNDTWSLALVVNLFGDYCLNVSTWDPVEHSEDVPLEIIRKPILPTKEQLAEYEELCSSPAPVVQSYSRNWTNKYRQTNQVGIWNKVDALAKEDALTWNKHDNALHYTDLHQEVTEEIDELMSDYADGTATYKKYTETIKILNSRLDVRNAKMKVKRIAKGKLLEFASTSFAEDHIKYDSDEVKGIYEGALSSIEIADYNGGYYGFH
tara:strand:- start:3208 stop:4185 length:978 start_codon:yes stop_codon:yes gene_type:complete